MTIKQVNTSDDVTEACAARWNIEQYHCESKQLTGIEKCQVRNCKGQRKYIITVVLASIVLHAKSKANNISICAVKNELFKEYIAALWRNPYIAFI